MANYTTITSDKSKKTALLLCIFGGFIGLHYFYVGRFGRGLLFLFTVGLFGFGWIMDIITVAAGGFKDNSGQALRQ